VEHISRNAQRVALLGWALGTLGAAAPAAAQVSRPPVQTERVLVLAPLPADPADSAYAVAFGDEFRSRLEGKSRRELTVVSKDKIGEALEASGFSRDALLDDNAASQLARFLQSDAYVIGRIETNPIPKVDIHFIDIRRSGLAGWVHVSAPKGTPAKSLAGVAADSAESQTRAAASTRECLDRRDRNDFNGAKERARRAFEYVPNHTAAAMCLAVVFEAMHAPPDSEIPVLEKAVKGDSVNTRTWEMLGRQYQARGTRDDSLKAADAFLHQLQADPSDAKLRTGVAALLITLKEHQRARDVLDAGLKDNPNDLQTLQLKARACEEGTLWPCLVSALAAQYELDSTLAGKPDFYAKIFGAAQQANDTAAMLKWSGEAVRRLPNDVTMLRARLAAVNTAHMPDSALAVNRRIAELDKTDIRPLLGMVQAYEDAAKIDSAAPLDPASLQLVSSRVDSLIRRRAVPAAKRDSMMQVLRHQEYDRELGSKLGLVDSLLQQVIRLKSTPAGQPADTTVWLNVALMYFKPATEMVQKRVALPLAIDWLGKSEKYDVRKQLTTQAEFFIGLAYTFNLSNTFDFGALQKSKSCRDLNSLDQYVKRLRSAITAGASVQQATATQVLNNVAGIEKFVADAGKAWKCP
jgi:tetratricopeptide (TPR) repeat protein